MLACPEKNSGRSMDQRVLQATRTLDARGPLSDCSWSNSTVCPSWGSPSKAVWWKKTSSSLFSGLMNPNPLSWTNRTMVPLVTRTPETVPLLKSPLCCRRFCPPTRTCQRFIEASSSPISHAPSSRPDSPWRPLSGSCPPGRPGSPPATPAPPPWHRPDDPRPHHPPG